MQKSAGSAMACCVPLWMSAGGDVSTYGAPEACLRPPFKRQTVQSGLRVEEGRRRLSGRFLLLYRRRLFRA